MLPSSPFNSFLQPFPLSASSIHPGLRQLTGADPPADQFPQHVGARSCSSGSPCSSHLFSPAQDTKEGEKEDILAPPSLALPSQAACASTRSSSPSVSSTAVRTGMMEERQRREGRGEGGPIRNKGRGQDPGGVESKMQGGFVSS